MLTDGGGVRDLRAYDDVRRVGRRANGRIEEVVCAALARIGIDVPADGDGFIAALIPFVIDQESLHTVPPLQSLPAEYAAGAAGAYADRWGDALRYRNVPLSPVPVLSAALAPFLIDDERAIDVEFVDGHNVYGANRFERHEGRRLLRRAIGYVYERLREEGGPFDAIAFEGDGFLIAAPRDARGAPLRERLRRILAAMNGEIVDRGARRAIGRRLATFYKQAHGTVLAPALLAHETRHDVASGLARRGKSGSATIRRRMSRLRSRHPELCSLLDAVCERPRRQQETLLALIEYRMFDPVLEPLTDALSRRGHPVRAFNDPGDMLAHMADRSAVFCRVELLSLLKSINEDPRGGFAAANEALKAVYTFLVAAIQRFLKDVGAHPSVEVFTFRRWGEFYFAANGAVPRGPLDFAAAIEDAFCQARYLVLDCGGRTPDTPYAPTLAVSCPERSSSRIVIPLIPAVTADAPISDDILSMPVEQPASTLRAITARLTTTDAPDVDVAFLADWTLNACDEKRGIPRLIEMMGATGDDLVALSAYYRPCLNRRGRLHHQIRRDLDAIDGFRRRLSAMSLSRRP